MNKSVEIGDSYTLRGKTWDDEPYDHVKEYKICEITEGGYKLEGDYEYLYADKNMKLIDRVDSKPQLDKGYRGCVMSLVTYLCSFVAWVELVPVNK